MPRKRFSRFCLTASMLSTALHHLPFPKPLFISFSFMCDVGMTEPSAKIQKSHVGLRGNSIPALKVHFMDLDMFHTFSSDIYTKNYGQACAARDGADAIFPKRPAKVGTPLWPVAQAAWAAYPTVRRRPASRQFFFLVQ